MVAEQVGVSQAAVTKMVRRLQDLKLARYARGKGLSLSPSGQKIALEVVRHHRLLELYLTEALGYSWDQVHEEAERLEHVISEQFEERIEKLLGYPTHDPHGAPIPTRDGLVEAAEDKTLANLEPGDHALIQRVSDGDSSMLSHLGKLGMYPGTSVEMLEREPYGGSLRIRISGEDKSIGIELAENVFVSAAGETK
jgi:DtxR family Mn-dependent transcriptional regulator